MSPWEAQAREDTENQVPTDWDAGMGPNSAGDNDKHTLLPKFCVTWLVTNITGDTSNSSPGIPLSVSSPTSVYLRNQTSVRNPQPDLVAPEWLHAGSSALF